MRRGRVAMAPGFSDCGEQDDEQTLRDVTTLYARPTGDTRHNSISRSYLMPVTQPLGNCRPNFCHVHVFHVYYCHQSRSDEYSVRIIINSRRSILEVGDRCTIHDVAAIMTVNKYKH